MKKYFIALLLILIAGSSLGDSKCYRASTTDSEFKFNKREKIILALPKYPSELEQSFINIVREQLINEKFRLVDSVKDAERILTFRIIENLTINFETNFTFYEPAGSDLKTVTKNASREADSGYTSIQFSMQDIGLIKEGKRATVWQGQVSTKAENFNEYPELVLEKLVDLYGKNKVDNEKIKKPKKKKKK